MLDRTLICPCERHERDSAEMGHCICHLCVDEDYEPAAIETPPERGDDSPWPHIIVYGAYWCRDTIRTFNLLNHAGVPLTADVAREEMESGLSGDDDLMTDDSPFEIERIGG